MQFSDDSSKSKNPGREYRSSGSSTLRFHRVAPGETLDQIAEEYYGDKTFWVLLYGSNEASIRKVGGLRAGLVLYVPFM